MNNKIIEIQKDLTKDNYNFLRDMLYETIFVPESEKPLLKSIINKPELSEYISNWGRKGDIGLIAKYETEMIGAIWVRVFPEYQKGYEFIDEKTPELSMAIKKEYRNMGIGTKLFFNILDNVKKQGYNTISLSVDKRNRAVNFYRRLGFERYEDIGTSYTMKRII